MSEVSVQAAPAGITAAFGYENDTASAKTVTLTKLGAVTNYALDSQTASASVKTNLTMQSADETELLILKGQPTSEVNTKLKSNYPCPIKDGVLYGTRMDTMLRVSKSDGSVLFDTPVSVSITIQHQMVTGVTAELIQEYVQRTFSSLYKDDGTSRIADLMRMSKTPTSD